jgi:hypothetical protein
MAPEQAEGHAREVVPAADIYSLGAILYELLTGRPPFRGATLYETIEQVKSVEPVPPSRLVPHLPRDVETIALKCLQKEPSRRYSTAGALADDLKRFLDGEPIVARPSPFWERGLKSVRRRPAIAALAVVIQLLLAVVLVLWARYSWELRQLLWEARLERNRAEAAGQAALRGRTEAERARREAQAEAYRATLSEVRALRLAHAPGWRAETLKAIGRLAAGDAPNRDPAELRSEAVACLGDLDARVAARVPVETSGIRGTGHGVWDLAFGPDGSVLACATGDGGPVRLWDVGDRLVPRPGGPTGQLTGLRFRPGGSDLLYRTDRAIATFRAGGTGTPPAAPTGRGAPIAFAIDRRGRRMVVGWNTHGPWRGGGIAFDELVVHDLGTGALIRTIAGPFDAARYKSPLALSPEGDRIAVMGPGHEVRLYQAEGDEPPVVLGRHRTLVMALAFSPDGAYLASGSDSGDLTARVWDVARRREHLTLYGHTARIWGLDFSPDGEMLATAGDDGNLRLWDVRTGQPLMTLRPSGRPRLSVAFSPDGARLAAGGLEVGGKGPLG